MVICHDFERDVGHERGILQRFLNLTLKLSSPGQEFGRNPSERRREVIDHHSFGELVYVRPRDGELGAYWLHLIARLADLVFHENAGALIFLWESCVAVPLDGGLQDSRCQHRGAEAREMLEGLRNGLVEAFYILDLP
jgi:hypothetical protein